MSRIFQKSINICQIHISREIYISISGHQRLGLIQVARFQLECVVDIKTIRIIVKGKFEEELRLD